MKRTTMAILVVILAVGLSGCEVDNNKYPDYPPPGYKMRTNGLVWQFYDGQRWDATFESSDKKEVLRYAWRWYQYGQERKARDEAFQNATWTEEP